MMVTITQTILINADKKKVWDSMLQDKTYRQWTTAFHAGSHFIGNWEKGTEMRFVAAGEDGKLGGLVSRIKENDLHKYISIEHFGMVSGDTIDTTSEEVKKWTPCFENYTFTEKGNQIEVKVEVQTPEDYKTMFEEMWPKALKELKHICES